jgi:hypothetical protein
VKEIGDKVITLLSLHVMYLLGIGFTAIVGMIFGKEFLSKKSHHWQKNTHLSNLDKMY